MFTKILIANRGEIACRVARTAKRMGIRTVAVYSDADANALHVKSCDEAYHIGGAAATDSYLRADKILEVAKRSGAQAVHPGYGFLSENAGFAEACAAAGIVFIGPPVPAIVAMGSKSEAKALMQQANVPLVPGYHGDDQALATLRAQSAQIGYPQLIKASAGGGGKGMRVVRSLAEFDEALQSARREALASFGDDHVLIERYLQAPRHVEVQVFADTLGHAVYVFERDCSVQRRHQKVIEEAPAPGMTPELRAAMGQAAVSAAKTIGYVGAGTVEFLLDQDGTFYFMEMNTRLQVEHPVTEMISGLDLVEWQLRVASGEPLPLMQDQLRINGHAFEARVYAEVPERDFLPATGRLDYLRIPAQTAHVRVDTGVAQGDEISMYYDPMIAKLIVWGEDRATALRRMQLALADYRIVGVKTNLAFLASLCVEPDFAAAHLDTGFIGRHMDSLFPPAPAIPDVVLAAVCLHELATGQEALQQQATDNDPYSPWGQADGWRMNLPSADTLVLEYAGETHTAVVHYTPNMPTGYRLETAHGSQALSGVQLAADDWQIQLGGQRLRVGVVRQGDQFTVFALGRAWTVVLHDPVHEADSTAVQGGSLVAPMPGAVVAVQVAVGDRVSAGDALMVVVAMKMEHTIVAPHAGEVTAVYFQVGDQVKDGDVLLGLE